jgi:hypothetical protein
MRICLTSQGRAFQAELDLLHLPPTDAALCFTFLPCRARNLSPFIFNALVLSPVARSSITLSLHLLVNHSYLTLLEASTKLGIPISHLPALVRPSHVCVTSDQTGQSIVAPRLQTRGKLHLSFD